jgi:FKBP-type peptidyl-prolyl cis-trans isomerase 2
MPVSGVVPGFSEAMKLMPKGAKYRIWIKPELGYGGPRPADAPPLDPKAAELATKVLTFEVEMMDFLPEAVVRQMQAQQMQQMQGAGGMPGGPPQPVAPQPAPAQPAR